MIRKVRNKGVNFGEVAEEMLKQTLTLNSGARLIDIGFDVYCKISMKSAERGHREVGRLHLEEIIGNQYIKQWGSFLSSGDNKTELIPFLVSRSILSSIIDILSNSAI